MARGPSFDVEPVEQALLNLPIIQLKGLFRRSSNYTFLAELFTCEQDTDAGEPGMLAVYKPASGESPLWDFAAGTLYRREVAAYQLSRALGWPRIPPTVVRESAPHGVGALQMFVHAEPQGHAEPEPEDELCEHLRRWRRDVGYRHRVGQDHHQGTGEAERGA